MKGTVELETFISDCWRNIFVLVKDSAVYIDHAAAECLHWYTGDKAYVSLKNAGAFSVHELAMYNFRYVKVENTKKAVIISTSSDSAFYRRTTKLIIEKNTFENCIIVSATHPDVMNYSSVSEEDRADYNKLKRDIKSWMNLRNSLQESTVEIIFRPIFLALLNNDLFVTPPFGNLMPFLDNNVTDELASDADHFVSVLHSLFTYLNVKEDIYTMGKFSEYLADKLGNLPAAVARRNNLAGITEDGVSLILIDRTLDLCTPTSNNTESLLARILCTLPHLPHHYNDVAINMSPLMTMSKDPSVAEIPGCLANSNKDIISMLISKKQKEILTNSHQLLTDMISKKSPKARALTRISAHSLEKLVTKFRDTNDFKSIFEGSKKLQTILAIIQALTTEKNSQLELLISLEKLILQNLAVSGESSSVLAQLSNIIKTRITRGLDTENLLALLIHVYSLAGTVIRFMPQQEAQLQESIADAIYEDIKILNENTFACGTSVYQQTLLLSGVSNNEAARETSTKIAEHIVNTLRTVAKQRASLTDYESLIVKPNSQEMARCVSILEQLLVDVLHSKKSQLHDLGQKSQSFMSSGFNLFLKGRAKHHPCDNPWMIVFVVGGVTPEECKMVKEISSSKPNCCVTLGGSRLLSPLDIVDNVLLSSIDR